MIAFIKNKVYLSKRHRSKYSDNPVKVACLMKDNENALLCRISIDRSDSECTISYTNMMVVAPEYNPGDFIELGIVEDTTFKPTANADQPVHG